jgi:hypothetical protein
MIRYQWKNFPLIHIGFSDGTMKIRFTKIKSIYKSSRRSFNFGSEGLDKCETLSSYTNTAKNRVFSSHIFTETLSNN